MPACQGARPNSRAMGPISATKDIIDKVQTKFSNISGRMLKRGVGAAEAGASEGLAVLAEVDGTDIRLLR